MQVIAIKVCCSCFSSVLGNACLTGRFCIVRTVNSYSLVNIPVQQISAALSVLNQYLCVFIRQK